MVLAPPSTSVTQAHTFFFCLHYRKPLLAPNFMPCITSDVHRLNSDYPCGSPRYAVPAHFRPGLAACTYTEFSGSV